MTPTEDISDYREVTAAERTALEQADAAWEEPSQSFIDLWNNAAGDYGCYNETTGFFELNGLTDISYSEALEIYNFSSPGLLNASTRQHMFFRSKLRTMMPINEANRIQKSWAQAFFASPNLEAVSFSPGAADVLDGKQMFSNCSKLKRILPLMDAENCNATGMFENCYALEEAKLRGIKNSVSFAWSPLLSLESLKFMIDNRPAHFTNAITITLHPEAYARVSDELFAQAAAKNITIATT